MLITGWLQFTSLLLFVNFSVFHFASNSLTFLFTNSTFVTSLSPPLALPFYMSFSECLSTSQQASRDAECWAHKFCLVWNRRWLPRTAGRFFITGAFLVLSTATATCHQTQAMLRVYVSVSGTWKYKRMAALKKTGVNCARTKCQKERTGWRGVEK